jgi:hypothetical protein
MESATEFPNEMALWMSCGSCVRSDFGFVSIAPIGPTDWAFFKTSDSARYHMLCAYFPKLAHTSLSCVDALKV